MSDDNREDLPPNKKLKLDTLQTKVSAGETLQSGVNDGETLQTGVNDGETLQTVVNDGEILQNRINIGEAEIDFSEDVTDIDNNEFSVGANKYSNYVSPKELEKLREFKVLDEVKSNDEDSDEEDSNSSDGVPEDEIEKMLDEDLPDDFKGVPKPKEKAYITREKIVLEEKGVNHFEVLPLDWMVVRHYSGMPIYMHRSTRVCTLSKPYFLGKGNSRRHDIPISAIPCLAYRKALEEEEKHREIDKKIEEQKKKGMWFPNNIGQAAANDQDTYKPNQSDSPIDSNKHNNDTAEPSIEITQLEIKTETEAEDPETKEQQNYITDTNKLTDNNQFKCPFSYLENKQNVANNAILGQEKELINNEKTNLETDNRTNSSTVSAQNDAGNNQADDIPLNRRPVILPGGIVMSPPRVESINTSWKTQHLTHEEVNEYCKSLFQFKTVNIMHFKRWADRRKYAKAAKARKTMQYPTLPEGTKLITIPAQVSGQDNTSGKNTKRDWVMNMNGGSYLSVFHEYVRRALQKQPVYEFQQLENASSPYQATVYIGGMQYGSGRGSSKRQAKSAAARASIHILIPEMREELDANNDPAEPDFSFFDHVGIEDPRITEFCATTCEPSPHAILRTCLLRNFGAGDNTIHTEMKKLEYQKIELTMKVGKHSASVICKNKKTAKQRASQAILQALHPHVRSWGSLLRLYGSRSVKSCKEKKMEEQQITLLQDKAQHNAPNHAVLRKLRQEMLKLRERDAAVVPIGTLLLKDDLPSHSGSNLNNVDL